MTTDALGVQRPMGTGALQSPTVTDRLLKLVDRMPGPASFWLTVFALLLLAVAHVWIWATGARPVGELEPEVIPPAVMLAYFLWLLNLLYRVADSSFDSFRPALGGTLETQERHRLELVSIPDRVAITTAGLTVIVLNVAYFGTIRPLRPPLPVAVELASGVLYVLASAAIGLLSLCAVRQLRGVSRLGVLATSVDIFKPGPVNALSRLTAATAIGIIAFVAAYALTTGITVPTAEAGALPTFVVEETLMVVLAVASFVLPLRVMHGRLLEEKNDLLSAAQDRLKAILARLHQAVEANDLAHADQLNMTLSSVLAERELLVKLPTWPWSTGTFRSVASALLLPVVIFVITRLIDQLI